MKHDVVGVELEGEPQALDQASRALLDIVQDSKMEHLEYKVQVIVRDEDGHEIGRRNAELRKTDEASEKAWLNFIDPWLTTSEAESAEEWLSSSIAPKLQSGRPKWTLNPDYSPPK